jgi:hypothetical protein
MNFLWFHKAKAAVTGKNSEATPVAVIAKQIFDPRQLPLGAQEFEKWSDRIISGLPTLLADPKSQKFALAQMIMHLGPQESHKPDVFFLKSLLKAASNQVAYAYIAEVQAEQKAKKEAAAQLAIAAQAAQAEETLKRAEALKVVPVPLVSTT